MFRFRLEKVLRHRRRLVDDEARKLQVLAAGLNRLLAERRRLEEDMEMAAEAAWRGRQGTVDLALQNSAQAFLQARRAQAQRLQGRIDAARQRCEDQRQVLVRAQQDVSVLESLETKQRQDWELQERRREQKLTDELAGRRRARPGC
ncbi:MAG TPA: flagellar export protein FliJ [Candidatus Krumholzibacteria bacterium]|nr:flagellar export protein FliJ [Candidatus Krumholzibacteria bacterium]HRX50915.1 flagellar export protein FliJ [Candidatus Krumholzibacteria bacterium]